VDEGIFYLYLVRRLHMIVDNKEIPYQNIENSCLLAHLLDQTDHFLSTKKIHTSDIIEVEI